MEHWLAGGTVVNVGSEPEGSSHILSIPKILSFVDVKVQFVSRNLQFD